jgi:RimJ/RimL family protein N-acetyltransferase
MAQEGTTILAMRAIYLTGEDFYLRAMVLEDKNHAVAWFNSMIPIDASAAEKILKEANEKGWREPDELYLAIVRSSDDEVIGGVTIEDQDRRTAWLSIRSAPGLENGDRLRARVLELVLPWLRDELEILVIRVHLPEDELEMIEAAKRLQMEPAIRLRQFQARPGHRVDVLGFQALNSKISLGENNA